MPYLKNYLYNYILEQLFILESEVKYNIKVYKLIIRANILFEKNLTSQANDQLIKAYKIAESYEDYMLLLQIKNLQLALFRKLLTGVDLLSKGTELFEHAILDIEKIKNEWKYAEINFKFINHYTYSYRARSKDDEKHIQRII